MKPEIIVIRDYDGFFKDRVDQAIELADKFTDSKKRLVNKIIINASPRRINSWDASLEEETLHLDFHSATRITKEFGHTLNELANKLFIESE